MGVEEGGLGGVRPPTQLQVLVRHMCDFSNGEQSLDAFPTSSLALALLGTLSPSPCPTHVRRLMGEPMEGAAPLGRDPAPGTAPWACTGAVASPQPQCSHCLTCKMELFFLPCHLLSQSQTRRYQLGALSGQGILPHALCFPPFLLCHLMA